MPLAVRTKPQALIVGHVINARPIRSKENPGEVIGQSLTVDTAGGGVYLTQWDRNGDGPTLTAGEAVAIVCSISESANGASFQVERLATADDVDQVVSAAGLNK